MKKNKYPHRLSRRGYAGLAVLMKDELSGQDDIDRARMWKQARVSKNGDIEDENLKMAVQRIDDYIQKKQEGEFTSNEWGEDVLTCTLKSREHGGRVRGVGSYVTPTMFFKQPRERKRETKNDLMEARKLIDEQNNMISLLNKRLSKLESEVAQDKDKDLEGKRSCTIKQPCYTSLEEDDNEQNSDEIVVVDKVNALQQMEFTSPEQKKARNKAVEKVMKKVQNYKKLAPSLKALYLYVEKSLKDGEGIHIEYDQRIFGTHVEIFLHLEDIVPFCDLEPISGNCILVYMGYLYKQLEENNALDKVLFVNPFDISYMVNVREETRSTTLANRLQNTSTNQIVLAPCNVGNHWILTVIDPQKSLVTVLDPIYHRISDNSWVNVVNMAIGQNNLKNLAKRNKKPNWDIFKAP